MCNCCFVALKKRLTPKIRICFLLSHQISFPFYPLMCLDLYANQSVFELKGVLKKTKLQSCRFSRRHSCLFAVSTPTLKDWSCARCGVSGRGRAARLTGHVSMSWLHAPLLATDESRSGNGGNRRKMSTVKSIYNVERLILYQRSTIRQKIATPPKILSLCFSGLGRSEETLNDCPVIIGTNSQTVTF